MSRVLDFSDGFDSAVQPTAVGLNASEVTNVPSGNIASTDVQSALNEVQSHVDTNTTAISGKQSADSDLTAIAGLSSTGLISRTGTGTASTRTITAGSTKATVSNGDGVAGNPTVDVAESVLNVGNMTGTLAIGHGGTGATAKAAAYDALSPNSTKGDVEVFGTTNTRLPVGSDTQVLTADSTQTLGVKWAAPVTGFSNPMTTLGDIIYENGTPAPARLAGNGTATKNILTQTGNGSGVSAAPAWDVLPGNTFWSGYYPASLTNYWNNTNTGGFSDFTVNGTIPSPTALVNRSFTVAKATSNLPGISFTAPRTGTIKMSWTVMYLPSQTAGATAFSMKLHETTTSTDLAFASGYVTLGSTAVTTTMLTLVGYFNATISTAYNFNVQSVSGSAGPAYIGATATSGAQLSIAMEYIT